ncbi:MAG: hypothetical protein R3B56_16890 [Candidatus Scalinduaceae bacterium]
MTAIKNSRDLLLRVSARTQKEKGMVMTGREIKGEDRFHLK